MLEKVMEDNASFLARFKPNSTVKTVFVEEKKKEDVGTG